MADPPRRLPLVAPTRLVPRRPGRRAQADRRRGVGEAIKRFLDETRSTSDEQTLLDALTAALRVVMPVSAVELTTERRVSSTAPVIRPSLITVPIRPGLSDLADVLHVRTAAGYAPDRWDLDLLQTVVLVFAAIRDRAGRRPDVELRGPRAARHSHPRSASLLGDSDAMVAVRHAVDRFAPTDFTILIQGETGTGKELVAQALHANSQRRSGRSSPSTARRWWTACSKPSSSARRSHATGVQGRPGKFELADRGTLFSMKWGFVDTRKRRCFAPSSRSRSNASAATDRGTWTPDSSWRRIGRSRGSSRADSSARISSID